MKPEVYLSKGKLPSDLKVGDKAVLNFTAEVVGERVRDDDGDLITSIEIKRAGFVREERRVQ